MKLDLNEIVAHLGKKIAYEIDEPTIEDPESGLKTVGPITGKVTFTNTGTHVVVLGKFHATLELECARCLSNYTMDVDQSIEEALPIVGHEFGETDEQAQGEEDEELPEDEEEPLFVDNIYDLTELLRQSIMVAVPIKPLCSEACKGLCPRCGKNLTEGPCECSPDDVNPAFAALAALLEEKKEEL